MISGQGCGEKILLLLFAAMCVGGTLKVLLFIAALDSRCYDGPLSLRCRLLVIIGGEAVYGCGLIRGREHPVLIMGLLGILSGCLLMACITDTRECAVYQFVWWIGGGVAGILLVCQCVECEKILQLILFCLLQEFFFCRLYGRADCHAFCVCAMAETAMGLDITRCLIHMLLAYCLLGVVQGLRHNIARNGNLKKPVPFLPYISTAFWMQMMVLWLF